MKEVAIICDRCGKRGTPSNVVRHCDHRDSDETRMPLNWLLILIPTLPTQANSGIDERHFCAECKPALFQWMNVAKWIMIEKPEDP